MKRDITDDELQSILEQLRVARSGDYYSSVVFKSFSFLETVNLTHDQLSSLCVSGLVPAKYLFEYFDISSDHIDLILTQFANSASWVSSVFTFAKSLNKEQIDFGLKYDKSHYSSQNVRLAAYNHPCCTESQKVRYNLSKGYS